MPKGDKLDARGRLLAEALSAVVSDLDRYEWGSQRNVAIGTLSDGRSFTFTYNSGYDYGMAVLEIGDEPERRLPFETVGWLTNSQVVYLIVRMMFETPPGNCRACRR